MDKLPEGIPTSLYYLLGVLIVSNVGSIITLATVGIRGVWWLSKLDSRVEKAQETAVRAHKRIDNIEGSDAE